MALLYTLYRLQKNFDWHLAVAHVNYGTRGKESDKDTKLVKEVAEKFGLPLYTLTKKMKGESSEDTLRKIRYDFFESLVKKHGFDFVALAHHQDDQAETVLLRLMRGSGTLGLSAMAMKRDIYVRPFLGIAKSEILNFLDQENIPYRIDMSNQGNLYLRNRVRNQLLPLLESYNPKIKKVLAETAKILQQEYGLQQQIPPLSVTTTTKKVRFHITEWLTLSKSEKNASIRAFFQAKGLLLPTKSLVETVIQDLSGKQKKGFTKEYSRLRVKVNNGMIDIHFKEID
jgi:tRNA(Ile)-lysidine synthase